MNNVKQNNGVCPNGHKMCSIHLRDGSSRKRIQGFSYCKICNNIFKVEIKVEELKWTN